MTKGFKDDKGNFHPTDNDSKLSSRDVESNEEEGRTLSEAEVLKAKKEFQEQQDTNTTNKIGLTKHRVQFAFGFNNGSQGTEAQRQVGNDVIERIVNMTKENNPEVKDWIIHSKHVYNEYNSVQRAISLAKPDIEKLIEWRNDNNPETWKWKSPIILDDGTPNSQNFFTSDDQNLGWLTDAYKGKMAITLMSPKEFLELASPRVARTGKRNDLRGDEFTKENIDGLTNSMIKGEPIDTVYLNIDKNLQVFSHEGLHRALSAIRAGIKQMPVYVYMNFDSFTDEQIQNVTRDPISHLIPDIK